MAKFRYINTGIWKDEWFLNLRGEEQRLFIYLLTNGQTNMAGVYQITLREMAFDTGIDQEEIKRIFRDRLQPDRKAFWELGWVIMPNWLRHQKPNNLQKVAIGSVIEDLPESLDKRLFDPQDPMYVKPLKAFKRMESNSNRNLKLKLNSNSNSNGADAPVEKGSKNLEEYKRSRNSLSSGKRMP